MEKILWRFIGSGDRAGGGGWELNKREQKHYPGWVNQLSLCSKYYLSLSLTTKGPAIITIKATSQLFLRDTKF